MPIGLSKWKISGRQAASEIRKFNLAIPIIAITAYAAAGDRQNSMDAGICVQTNKTAGITGSAG